MAMKPIPVYSICSLSPEQEGSNEFIADRFDHYLASHTDLRFPHKHDFYHLVFFTEGSGSHTIDFVHFPVKPGQLYCMVPGQVHTWHFEGRVNGFIVNFSESFLQQLLAKTNLLDQFSFFSGTACQQVLEINTAEQSLLTTLFNTILREQADAKLHAGDFIRTALLQLFFTINRTIAGNQQPLPISYNAVLFKNFKALVDEHYSSKKLTKDYAAMLYITPNHLNALTKDVDGRSAGEVIRDRVLLEAKRLLINAGMSVAEIAASIGFEDNSYFTKFFKKYERLTPLEFKKKVIDDTL